MKSFLLLPVAVVGSLQLMGQENLKYKNEIIQLKEKSYKVSERETVKGDRVIFDEVDKNLVVEGEGDFGAEVEYVATEEIILGPGFEVEEGSEFSADLEEPTLSTPEIVIFPNPTFDGHFKVELSNNVEIKGEKYQLYNSLGEIIKEDRVIAKMTFDVSGLSNGTYLLKIISPEKNDVLFQQSIVFSK